MITWRQGLDKVMWIMLFLLMRPWTNYYNQNKWSWSFMFRIFCLQNFRSHRRTKPTGKFEKLTCQVNPVGLIWLFICVSYNRCKLFDEFTKGRTVRFRHSTSLWYVVSDFPGKRVFPAHWCQEDTCLWNFVLLPVLSVSWELRGIDSMDWCEHNCGATRWK